MHNFVSAKIFNTAARIRNPSLFNIYRGFKRTESLDREQLKAAQFEKLKSLLCFAEQYSPFYKKLFADIDFQPHKMNTFDDITVISPSNKRLLIDKNEEVHSQYSFKKLKKAITSGTSGESLSFMRSEEWDSANRAGVMRGYSWYGVKVSDKNGYFWGYNIDSSASKKIRIMDAAQNRFRLFHYTDSEIEKFCEKIKDATYLSGYSSMIYKVAKEVNKKGLQFNNIKMVKGTAEMILPKYQDEVQQAFGMKMISEYGAAETGLIAFECPHGSQHINTDAVYVETDDAGEIYVTNLYSHSFPIIRYRLGDVVKLSNKICSCGKEHPLIEEILGRKGANVIGTKQEYPSLVFYYVFKNLAAEGLKLNYKAVQREAGFVILQIEGKNNEKSKSLIRKHLTTYFNDDVKFDVEFIESFSSEKKKQQSFTSYLE